ncbi:hypothetical protein V2J09_014958 [Rumex salicifolius]
MVSETIKESEAAKVAEDMELEEPKKDSPSASGEAGEDAAANTANGASKVKREREGEEDDKEAEESVDGGVAKKQKVEKSVEEERLEKLEDREGGGEGEVLEEKSGPVSIGPKTFESSLDMFDYFFKFLHHWSPNLDVNKYEHMALLDLIKKGHSEPEKKIGCGVKSFQIRNHPEYKSRCFFVVRNDQSAEDFSFRKCVDHILPLPENMKANREVNKVLGGGGGGRRGGSGGGRGRGGRGRGGQFRSKNRGRDSEVETDYGFDDVYGV